MNILGVNKKTNAAGISAIILIGSKLATQIISQQYDQIDISEIATLVLSIGALFTKDRNVTGGTIPQPTVPNTPTLPSPVK